MRNRNLILGIAAGAALVSAAIYLKRSGRLTSLTESAGEMLDSLKNRMSGNSNDSQMTSDHGGNKLAQKARHKAEQMVAMHKNGQH